MVPRTARGNQGPYILEWPAHPALQKQEGRSPDTGYMQSEDLWKRRILRSHVVIDNQTYGMFGVALWIGGSLICKDKGVASRICVQAIEIRIKCIIWGL